MPASFDPNRQPPQELASGEVCLRFVGTFPGNPARGLVPGYHFLILHTKTRRELGHINFRVGHTEHVMNYAGHIGYEISRRHRGKGYAQQACRALAPFVREFYDEVIITTDPDNHPSRKTIERLGAILIETLPVPPHDPVYESGSRMKLRFKWKPQE
jgi:tagatose 1,6-diphosphate aldolase